MIDVNSIIEEMNVGIGELDGFGKLALLHRYGFATSVKISTIVNALNGDYDACWGYGGSLNHEIQTVDFIVREFYRTGCQAALKWRTA